MAARAAELVLAYARGRPAQTQNVRVIRRLEDLTEAELIALAGLTEDEQDGATRH